MIKKPEDIKKVFVNGARPTESDFADLIDSFVPRDSLPDDDLEALRQIIAWWRKRSPACSGDTGTSPSAGASDSGGAASAPAPTAGTLNPTDDWAVFDGGGSTGSGTSSGAGVASPAGGASSAGSATPAGAGTAASVVTVPADGKWYPLSITEKTVGTWMCLASTVDARSSYRIKNTAMAAVGARAPARRLVQNVERDSLLPWHTIQFKWVEGAGSSYALNVRARIAFGPNCKGLPTQIRCEITRRAAAGQG
ncbi:hypothetical protein [Trinickia dinghuensis]|uniref:Uncharacterized protein n=1 Tax=Trinickia dinghuensis TaxID=2291023 RepID=A0A3D8JWT4_9BURK|nr:hypothetical protein [Trinickia dinghuensis]RDU97547.1 hypothetical protein DWV00_16820 [Trinickia dinghuensis]